MTIGKFNIEDYQVTVNGNTETRQRIIYYDLYDNEITTGRYTGDVDDILPNYVNLDNCPPRIMRWQFRAQLALMESPDINFTSLEEYITYLISQMTGDEKIKTDRAWNYANTISRYSLTVATFATVLGLSSSEVDNIFINADQITI